MVQYSREWQRRMFKHICHVHDSDWWRVVGRQNIEIKNHGALKTMEYRRICHGRAQLCYFESLTLYVYT